MPDPPGSSWPLQFTVKLAVFRSGGNGVTLLVGAPELIVTRACFRRIGSLARVFVVDLVGGDQAVVVEIDVGHVADLRAGGQAGLGLDRVVDLAHAAAGAVLGGQETGQDVGGQTGRRIDRDERGEDGARSSG